MYQLWINRNPWRLGNINFINGELCLRACCQSSSCDLDDLKGISLYTTLPIQAQIKSIKKRFCKMKARQKWRRKKLNQKLFFWELLPTKKGVSAHCVLIRYHRSGSLIKFWCVYNFYEMHSKFIQQKRNLECARFLADRFYDLFHVQRALFGQIKVSRFQ